jgi:hypothetical protein
MELLGEMLIVVLEFLGELVLQFVIEGLAELGIRTVSEPFRRRPIRNPWLAALGYLLLGGIAGGISLLIFPTSMITSRKLRWANLFLTPLVAGLLMASLGAWRKRRQQVLVRLDRFSYGFLFAFGMALVRFFWTR